MTTEPLHSVPHPDLAGYILGLLSPEEAENFENHLAECPACRDEVGELSGMPALLDLASPPAAVPSDLRAKTLSAVEQAARTTDRGKRRARYRWVALGAAVLLVVGVLGGVAATRDSGRTREASWRVALTAARTAPTGATGWADIRETPDGQSVDLVVQNVEPTAGKDMYYECWYLSNSDSPNSPDRVSAGTFTVDQWGTTRVHMVTAADPSQYRVVNVTLEPNDGNPNANGRVVLWGPPGKG